MEIQLGNPEQLGWLWLAPLLVALCAFGAIARHRAQRRFATFNRLRHVLPAGQGGRRMVGFLLLALTLLLLVIALIDLRWGKVSREVPQQGIEVVFLLDVSRSMLANDATPNRLERAKQQIRDTIDEMAGDRIALVLFAGEVRQHVPLTSHYEDFKESLALVGPHNLRRGGSRLGDAIRVATQSFLDKTMDHKAIMVFTDGEDHESRPIEAARQAAEDRGIRIFTVGLGDFEEGSRIPVQRNQQRGYLTHEGQQVWSKLNGEVLKQIATETGGAYIPAGTKQVDMAEVYHGYIANVDKTEFESATIDSYQARFQWFLAPAVLFLVAELIWTTRRHTS